MSPSGLDAAPTICVYCAADGHDSASMRLAANVGTEIGSRGWHLVSGGGNVAMLGELARAARAAGAHTTGVIPNMFLQAELADFGAHELIVTDTFAERKRLMAERADAFLTLPGGLGTLEELLDIWTAASLGIHQKAVVMLDPDGHYRGLLDWLENLCDRGFARSAAIKRLVVATRLASAFDALDESIRLSFHRRLATLGSGNQTESTPSHLLSMQVANSRLGD
nr:TIGR00730 family Rossman fold protein [Mycobacterium vicinigordonae]